jgi:hypothetical protein
MYVASLLILMSSTGGWRLLILGGTLALAAFALSLYTATRGAPGRARPSLVYWSIGGVAVMYALLAAGAAIAGPEYAVAALFAAIIPMTAVSLLLATLRSKTVEKDGDLEDVSAAAEEDPLPGIGFDDATPLGDTPEHSEADTPR